MEDEVSQEFLLLEERSKKHPVMEYDYNQAMDEVWEELRNLENQLIDLRSEVAKLKNPSGRGC